MSSNNRVFITGLGALTPSGNTLEENWRNLVHKNTSIGPIENEDLSNWPCHLGAELKNFKPAKMLPDRKLVKVISRHDAMGINAAVQAVEHSKLMEWKESDCSDEKAFNDSVGVYVGSPGTKYFQQYDFLPLIAKSKGDMKVFAEKLFEEVHPMWLLRILPNNVLAYVGITYGFKGANHNITNHAVSGLQALIEAQKAIACGQIERAVVVAYDAGTEPQALFYYAKTGLLSQTGLRPFDASADGTVLSEGAAAIVLESEASAKGRNAHCYGEIMGSASLTEAHGLFSIDKSGDGLASVLTSALKSANYHASDIDHIIGHANANPVSDKSEALAIQSVFGDNQPTITGFKWCMGHTLAASGLLDVVLSTQALHQRSMPGLPEYKSPTEHCNTLNILSSDLACSPNDSFMVINRGFACMNASMVVRGCG